MLKCPALRLLCETLLPALLLGAPSLAAQEGPWSAARQKEAREQAYKTVNYDVAAIPAFRLEDPLTFADGRKLLSAAEWPARRKEILDIFQREMYGQIPASVPVYCETLEQGSTLTGFATRRQVRMWFRPDKTGPKIDWLILAPSHARGPVPVILLLNYTGNHELLADPEILLPDGWMRTPYHERGFFNRDGEDTVFPISSLIVRGYAVVTACYCDISPDPDPLQEKDGVILQDGFAVEEGVFRLWGPRDPSRTDNTTALAAWAWGLMRGVDMIEKDPSLDSGRILLTGYSRLGKAAILAGAYDERIPLVVPIQTGGGGVPLSKHRYGECVATEVASFRHWFCRAYDKYAGNEAAMPFDQHLLLSCVAPRALLVEGFDKPWFDTEGEFLALQAASPVWTFLGRPGLPDVPWPADYDTAAIGPCVGYVRRDGGHGISAYDWNWMLDFADRLWAREVFPDGSPVSAWFQESGKASLSGLGRRFVLTDYGVQPDSSKIQTRAIQRVIDLAAEKGGVVVVPPGVFVSGALDFRQGTHLWVEGTLKGSDRVRDFPLRTTRIEGQTCTYFPALINIGQVDGFVLGGSGTLDGSGTEFWREYGIRRKWNADGTNKDGQRPRLVFISESSNVTVQDLHMKDSPFWTNHAYKSHHLRFLDLTVTSPSEGEVVGYSTDAIDLDACHDVLIKGCYMDVCDDGVVLKGGKGTFADLAPENGPNRNILIEDCVFGRTHGCLTLGSECIAGRNVILRRCKSENTRSVLWLKLRPDTPQRYEYISVEDVTGKSDVVLKVRPWTQYYKKDYREDMPMTQCSHISLKNLSIQSPSPLDVVTSGQYLLQDFTWDGKDLLAAADPEPTRRITASEAGAVGDGKTLNTAALQGAIDRLSAAGGGTLLLQDGSFLTGSLFLKDHVELRVEAGARLLGSTHPAHYVPVSETAIPKGRGHDSSRMALLVIDRAKDVKISGMGVIDGQGRALALAVDSLNHWQRSPEMMRQKLIFCTQSSGVTIENLHLRNSSVWGVSFDSSEDILVQGVHIHNRAWWNNDGIDITDCRRVHVRACDINSADDGICLKSNRDGFVNEDILIEDCDIVSSASAVKFGTASYGGWNNVTVRNIRVRDTFRSAIAIESVDGANIQNILVDGVEAVNTGNPLFIRLGRRHTSGGSIRNVTIRNLRCQVPFIYPDLEYDVRGPIDDSRHNPHPCSITGLPGLPVRDVVIEHVELTFPGRASKAMGYIPPDRLDLVPEKETHYPEFDMFGELPAHAFYLRHIDGIRLKDVKINLAAPDFRPPIVQDDVRHAVIDL